MKRKDYFSRAQDNREKERKTPVESRKYYVWEVKGSEVPRESFSWNERTSQSFMKKLIIGCNYANCFQIKQKGEGGVASPGVVRAESKEKAPGLNVPLCQR